MAVAVGQGRVIESRNGDSGQVKKSRSVEDHLSAMVSMSRTEDRKMDTYRVDCKP